MGVLPFFFNSFKSMPNSNLELKISVPNWAVKDEAQPRTLRYKDRAVTVYISENHELTIEIGGDFVLEKLASGSVEITLPSDS